MHLLLLKFSGRGFLVEKKNENEYKSFIVCEFKHDAKVGDVIEMKDNAFIVENLENKLLHPISCSVKVIKVLHKKITISKYNRRKRHKITKGYKQVLVYLKPDFTSIIK